MESIQKTTYHPRNWNTKINSGAWLRSLANKAKVDELTVQIHITYSLIGAKNDIGFPLVLVNARVDVLLIQNYHLQRYHIYMLKRS